MSKKSKTSGTSFVYIGTMFLLFAFGIANEIWYFVNINVMWFISPFLFVLAMAVYMRLIKDQIKEGVMEALIARDMYHQQVLEKQTRPSMSDILMGEGIKTND